MQLFVRLTSTTLALLSIFFVILAIRFDVEPWQKRKSRIYGWLSITSLGISILLFWFDWNEEQTKMTDTHYSHLRTEVPDRTNWGCFEIYPENNKEVR